MNSTTKAHWVSSCACLYVCTHTHALLARVCLSPGLVPSSVEHQKAQIVTIEKQKSHDQKVSRIEAQLKSTQSTMNQMKFKSTIFLVVIMVSVFAVLGNL